MKFIEVTELPEPNVHVRRPNSVIYDELDRFMAMNVKMAKVADNDLYPSTFNCYSALRSVVKWHVMPIDVKLRNNEVYLIRRDI